MPLQRPGDMLAHQRRGAVAMPAQAGHGVGIAGRRVAQRHGDVAQPALVADAADGRAGQAGVELLRASSPSDRSAAARPGHGGARNPPRRSGARTCSTGTPAGSRRSRRCGCRAAGAAAPGSAPDARWSGRRCSAARPARRAPRWRRWGTRRCRRGRCRNGRRRARPPAAAGRCRSRPERTTTRRAGRSDRCACRSSRGPACSASGFSSTGALSQNTR